MNVLLALTAAELVVFEMKAGMTGKLKLKDPLRRFPRNQVEAEVLCRRHPAHSDSDLQHRKPVFPRLRLRPSTARDTPSNR